MTPRTRPARARWRGTTRVLALLAVGASVIAVSPERAAYHADDGGPALPTAAAPALAVTRVSEPPAPGASTRGDAVRLRVAITDTVPRRLPAEGPPGGWEVREFQGRAAVDLVRDAGRMAARLRTDDSSFVMSRDVVLDLARAPHLTWSWKATRLPVPGDAREASRDDQAIGVYIVFPRWPSPRTSSDVLGYVWDTRAPIGTRVVSRRSGNVRVIVVESGPARLDAWQRVTRNVAADYAALFGGAPPPRVGRVAVMADSDDTGGRSEAFVGDLTFSPTPPKSAENATIMLR